MKSLSTVIQQGQILDLSLNTLSSESPLTPTARDGLSVLCCEFVPTDRSSLIPLYQADWCPCSVFLQHPWISSCILSSADAVVSSKLSAPLIHTQGLSLPPEKKVWAWFRGEDKRGALLSVSTISVAKEAEEGGEVGVRLSSLSSSSLPLWGGQPDELQACTRPNPARWLSPCSKLRGWDFVVRVLPGRMVAWPSNPLPKS